MIFGAALFVTWVILLIRYPNKALPVSLAALVCLLLVAASVYWLDRREQQRLSYLELRLAYSPGTCPADRPLGLTLLNGSKAALVELRWRIAAYAPGDSVNLAQNLYEAPRYRGPGELLPGATWQDCLPLPVLRPGYRPDTLEFRAERLQGSFAP